MLYVRLIKDLRDNLVDIEYFCESHREYGNEWPGGMETEYPKYCAVCVHEELPLEKL